MLADKRVTPLVNVRLYGDDEEQKGLWVDFSFFLANVVFSFPFLSTLNYVKQKTY